MRLVRILRNGYDLAWGSGATLHGFEIQSCRTEVQGLCVRRQGQADDEKDTGVQPPMTESPIYASDERDPGLCHTLTVKGVTILTTRTRLLAIFEILPPGW